MKKYIGIYKNGKEIAVWAIDMKAAKFRLKDYVRLNGEIVTVKKVA